MPGRCYRSTIPTLGQAGRRDRRVATGGRPKHDRHLMFSTIVFQGDRARINLDTVQFRHSDTAASMIGIGDGEAVKRAAESPVDRVMRPHCRYARVQANRGTVPPEPEKSLKGRLIHPTRRTRVPRPAAATNVHRVRIHVGRHHIRLRTVSFDRVARSHVVDRIDHVEELHRFVTLTEPRKRDDRPDGGVRVLPTVLAHAGKVTFDVSGIEGRPIERGREQQHDLCIAPHQMRSNGVHCSFRAAGLRRSRQHGP